MTKKEQRIFHMKSMMEHAKMQANWWIAYAPTWGNLSRDIQVWDDFEQNRVQATDDYKIKDAMDTAQRHMKMYLELAENILSLEKEND